MPSHGGAQTVGTPSFTNAHERRESLPNSAENEEILDIGEGEDEPAPFDYDITSYGADFPVDALVKRVNSGDIVIPTFGRYHGESGQINVVGFQREYVWSKFKADRFIESLLLGLPVPGIFLVRDNDHRYLVLDGQQRLGALQQFCAETNRPVRRLGNVHENFRGKCFAELDPDYRRKLENSIIHATVVRQNEPRGDQSSIYMIFERLNTGGVNLQPQEIRVALYNGPFAHLLGELNDQPAWRSLYGNKSLRLKDMEMILRFLAFYYCGDDYSESMKDFLNKYMASNRNLEKQRGAEIAPLFRNTTAILDTAAGMDAFRPDKRLNAAVVDSVLTGVAKRQAQGPIEDRVEVRRKLKELFSNPDYIAAVKTGTSQKVKVMARMQLATQAFADIE